MSESPELIDNLLLRCARGDHSAFEQLYRLVAPRLFALCRRMMRREELAEEALQESFVQIWRDAAKFDPHRALATTWMGVIVRHRCLDMLRRRRPEVSLEEDDTFIEPTDDGAGPLELTLHEADRYALGHCLKTLSEPQRLSITLAFYRGFSHQQLGAYLATPVGTVKSWIRRGLMQLKRCLQQ